LPYRRGNPQKTSVRKPSDEEAVRIVMASNGVPFLQMRLVGSHRTSGREKGGKCKGWGINTNYITLNVMYLNDQIKKILDGDIK
jgi:hypothetical protein